MKTRKRTKWGIGITISFAVAVLTLGFASGDRSWKTIVGNQTDFMIGIKNMGIGDGLAAVAEQQGAALHGVNYSSDGKALLCEGLSFFDGEVVANDKVGIGTENPEFPLDVVGMLKADSIKLPTGSSDGYVLTSDTTGVGSWQQKTDELVKATSSDPNPGYLEEKVDNVTIEVSNDKIQVKDIASKLRTYDSGWFSIVGNTSYIIDHNLGTTRVLVQIYGATDENGTNMGEISGSSNDAGTLASQITTSQCVIRTMNNIGYIWNGSSWTHFFSHTRIVIMALE